MTKQFRLLVLGVALSIFACSMPFQAKAAPVAIKVSTHAAEGTALFQSLETMKKFIEEKSNNKYRVDLYGSFKLGTMEESYQGMGVGTIHFLLEATSNISNFMPTLAMFDVPYLFPSADVADKVLSGPMGEKILAAATNKAVTPLTFVRYTYRNLFTPKNINSIQDLKGLKMRGSASPVHLAVLKAMGMTPTPMAGSEVYTGLQQGTIEGADCDNMYAIKSNWYEPCKTGVQVMHTYLPQLLYVSTRWWNKLSGDDKLLFEEAVVVFRSAQHDNAIAEDNSALEALQAKGLKIYTPSQEEMTALHAITKDVYKQFPKIDVKLLDELKTEIARH